MIRRGFWLVLGAALGVTGYRRAGKLARAMLPGRRPAGRGARSARRGTGGTAAFLRDVRDGMDEYLDRHPGHPGPTLEGQQVRGRLRSDMGRSQEYPGIDYAKDGR
jgi:hypothetical protein